MADFSDFHSAFHMPMDAPEEQIGAELLEESLGNKPIDATAKRLATRSWWQSQASLLRSVICDNHLLRESLFGPSERDRNAGVAIICDLLVGRYTGGVPIVTLLAVTCHYGMDKLCVSPQEKASP